MLIQTLQTLFSRDLAKLKTEIAAYKNEDNLWRAAKGITNPAGNLCLHLIGNINTYIGAEIGKSGYIRNREQEFSLKNIPRQQLLEKIDSTDEAVRLSLSILKEEDLEKEYPVLVFEDRMTTGYFLVHLAAHLSYHLGQISYHRRLTDNDNPLKQYYEKKREGYLISTDPSLLDTDMVHDYLSRQSYWAENIPVGVVQKSVANSLCFGLYAGNRQIGFARLITDRATFAYLADVFIIEAYRGRGLSKWLIEEIQAHPELQYLRRWMLGTRDAHGLYEQFGWTVLDEDTRKRFMQRHNKDVYRDH